MRAGGVGGGWGRESAGEGRFEVRVKLGIEVGMYALPAVIYCTVGSYFSKNSMGRGKLLKIFGKLKVSNEQLGVE